MIRHFSQTLAAVALAGGLITAASAQDQKDAIVESDRVTEEPMIMVDGAYVGVCTKDSKDTIVIQFAVFASQTDLNAANLSREAFVTNHQAKVFENISTAWKDAAASYTLTEIYADVQKQNAFLRTVADTTKNLFTQFESETGITVTTESFVVGDRPHICQPFIQ